MAVRPRLRALPGGAGIGETRFCGRCGRPPLPGTQRVCRRCGDGVVLTASAHAAPRPGEPFIVVDLDFTVRALSTAAEGELGVTEDEALGAALGSLVHGEGPSRRVRVVPCGDPPALLVVLGAPVPSLA